MDIAERWMQATWSDVGWSYLGLVVGGLGKLYLIGLVFFFVERIRPAVPQQKFFKTDFFNELAYPVFNSAFTTPVFTFVSLLLSWYVFGDLLPEHVFADALAGTPFVVQVLFVMFVADIAVWLEHWFAHRVLWNYHALHHMTPEVSWLTHARVHPVNGLTIAFAGLVAQRVFGLDGAAAATGGLLVLGISMWEHANLDFAWPKPLCWLFVSPHYHRWHHAADAAAVDRNFCLVFPFIDLAMGTYYCPEHKPAACGVLRGADENPIPDSFVAQMRYPFARSAESLGLRFGVPAAGHPVEEPVRDAVD